MDFFREAISSFISYFAVALNINFGLCLSIHMSRYEAPRKLGKQERDVRVAQGAAESNSSLLGALRTQQVLHILIYGQLKHKPIIG